MAKKPGETYYQYLKGLKPGKHKPFYLFTGDNLLQKEECIIALRSSLDEGYSYSSYNAGDAEGGFADMMESLATADFFQANKLFFLREADSLDEDGLSKLAEYLDDPVEGYIVAASSGEPRKQKRDEGKERVKRSGTLPKLKAIAEKKGVMVNTDKNPTEAGTLSVLNELAAQRGLELDRESAHYMIFNCGDEPRNLRDELDKIAVFYDAETGKRRKLTLEDFQQVRPCNVADKDQLLHL